MPALSPSEAFPLIGPWADHGLFLARDGALCAFVELDGRDPDGMGDDDHVSTMLLARNAAAALPPDARVQTYYWHAFEPLEAPAHRNHSVVDRIERDRHHHLSTKRLYRSRMLTVISVPTSAIAGSLDPLGWITTALLAPFDTTARQRIRNAVTYAGQATYLNDVLNVAARNLRDAVELFRRRWSGVGESRQLGVEDAWAWVRALSTLSAHPFRAQEPAPEGDWYGSQIHGRTYPCQIGGLEFVKSEMPLRYARFASVARLTTKTVPGWWAKGTPNPLTLAGDYVLCVSSAGLSPLQRAAAFMMGQNELDRSRLSIMRALTNKEHRPEEDPSHQAYMSKARQLAEAKDSSERFAKTHLIVAAIGDTADAARDTALTLDSVLSQASVVPVWESAAAIDAYLALQPGAKPYGPRALMLNTYQTAATGLNYRIAQGARRVRELDNDEPLITLETVDGQPYGFSPFVGEKATIIGVGPSRSGKTFFQNVTAAHWPKYGGLFATLDFDHGGLAVPMLYGNDGAIFDASEWASDAGQVRGLNPFRAQGRSGAEFRAHMTRLCLAMLASNDDPAMRSLADGEQAHIDRALGQMIEQPEHLQTLSNFIRFLPSQLAAKFSRWVITGEGRYSRYLDNETDGVGQLTRLATAFNLTAIRDDDAARGPVILEILWRVTQAVEDMRRLTQPKKFKVDEARLALRDPIIGPYLAEKAVTWAKFKGSLELWSQSPSHFREAPHWSAIRSSAAMFIFTANGAMDTQEAADYRNVFGLTDADVSTIRNLTPKREIYVVRPDDGQRKTLILDADDSAKRWASSTADVVAAQLAQPNSNVRAIGGNRHAS